MIDRIKNFLPRKIKFWLKNNLKRVQSLGKSKIFGIGFNKTGTTSLKVAMEELGFVVGNEYHAKFLFEDWKKREFKSIIKFSEYGQFFQDSPYSLPYTFIPLDFAYPNSKFILTVRDSDEQWYRSLVNFHGKLWGDGNVPPTAEDLKNATSHVYKGRPFHTILNIYDVTEEAPYKKDVLIKAYNDHLNLVKDYFRHRSKDLLVLNVAEKGAYQKLCDFLQVESERSDFPWKNKTESKR